MQELPWSDACERNKEPIRAVLARWLDAPARVLEVGSGTGQHAVYFAANLPHLQWQPSDRAEHLPGLAARIDSAGLPNLAAPVCLDVMARAWGVGAVDHVYTANTCHIMPWAGVCRLVTGAARRLASGGLLIAYGPFHHCGAPTSPSNIAFDRSLRAQEPTMGIRDDRAMAALAATQGLQWVADEAMPANNRILVWRRA